MFNFLEKLITIILPRIRHFRSIDFNVFDGKGNVSLGLSPLLIVPELESYFEYFECIRGINITLVITASYCSSNYKLKHSLPIKNRSLGPQFFKSKMDQKTSLLLTGLQLPVMPKN